MLKNNVKDILELTSIQEGILFHSSQTLEHSYIVQISILVEGNINCDMFEKAIKILTNKYDALKSNFIYKDVEKPVRVVFEKREPEVYIGNISISELNNYIKYESNKEFDLERDVLIRFSILKHEQKKVSIIVTFHHIIMDGWCKNIILEELFGIYNSLLNNYNYNDYEELSDIEYCQWLKKNKNEHTEKFWIEYLKNFTNETNIPYKKLNLSSNSEYEEVTIPIKNGAKDIKNVSRKFGITPNIICMGLWGIMIQQICNSDDIIFSTVFSNRDIPLNGIENMVGIAISTLPVRISSIKNLQFDQYLNNLSIDIMNIHENSNIDLLELKKMSNCELFDHILIFENKESYEEIKKIMNRSGLKLISIDIREHTNYPITATITYDSDDIQVKFIYDKTILKKKHIEKINYFFKSLINQMRDNPYIKIKKFHIYSDKDILAYKNINNTSRSYDTKSISEIFENIVDLRKDNIAINYDNRKISYAELDKSSNKIARKIVSLNTGTNIGLYIDRSPEQIISMIGVLKSDHSYVPIEVGTPMERIISIIDEMKIKCLIISRKNSEIFQGSVYKFLEDRDICLIYIEDILIENILDTRLDIDLKNDVAYIINTSGSTGKPKGVFINHDAIKRICIDTNYIKISADDNFLQLSNYAFDGSVFDIYGALLNGGRLTMIDKLDILDLKMLSEKIYKENISIIFMTTALFNSIIDINIDCLSNVNKILFGGERHSINHVRKAFNKLGPNKIIHVYGPTEATVYATYYKIDNLQEDLNTIPIGKPITNTKVFVMNTYDQVQPKGLPGELFIAGTGLAKKYSDEIYTKEKFIYINGLRLYKTDDICVLNENDELEFIERSDRQVKIRGFRIEIEEIEKNLLLINNVKKAHVIPIFEKGTVKYLIGYIESDEEKIDSNFIKTALSQYLPAYMIPQKIVRVKEIPLNRNGKIDDSKLPNKHIFEEKQNENFHNELSDMEKQFIEIVSILLETDINILDKNFYDIGGDSIKVISIISKVREKGLEIKAEDILKSKTIREMLSFLKIANVEKGDYSSLTEKYDDMKNLFD